MSFIIKNWNDIINICDQHLLGNVSDHYRKIYRERVLLWKLFERFWEPSRQYRMQLNMAIN